MTYRPTVTIPKADKVDWNYVHNFSPEEFPEDPTYYAEPFLIHRLQDLRSTLGRAIHPSPVSGAMARDYGSKTSQHYIGNFKNPTRLSTAIDIFPEGRPIDCYTTLVSMIGINGIGVYLGTRGVDGLPWVMFHIDIRKVADGIERPLIWIADKANRYYYPQKAPQYWSMLRDEKMFIDKVKGK